MADPNDKVRCDKAMDCDVYDCPHIVPHDETRGCGLECPYHINAICSPVEEANEGYV